MAKGPITTRDVYVAYGPGVTTVRDAKAHVRYTHPGYRIVSGRKVDPGNTTRGYIVVIEA